MNEPKLYKTINYEIHTRKREKYTERTGIVIACVLLVSVLVCLVCNLATAHRLDWFFVVLASVLVLASVTVVPLLIQENRLVWTMAAFVVSLLLLLFVGCTFTGGDWFLVAAVCCVLGLSVLFLPYIVYHIPIPSALSNKKGLMVMIWDTIWLYAVIIVLGYYHQKPPYWSVSLKVTTVSVILPWLIFICIRYVKADPFVKGGIGALLGGIYAGVMNDVIEWGINGTFHFHVLDADFSRWGENSSNANVALINLVVFGTIGVVLIIIGVVRQSKKRGYH